MSFRNQTGEQGAYLHFGVKDTTSDSANTLSFAIDNISVNQVPEPLLSSALLALAGLAVVTLRSRFASKGDNRG